MGSHLDTFTETQIVARLARGDKQLDIMAEMGVAIATVTAVKKRNKENLAIIKQKTLEKQIENAEAIKQKSNAKLSKRLDRDDEAEKIISKAQSEYLNGDISLKEFSDIMRRVKELSVNELVTISKEMHHQTVETDKPPAAAGDLTDLIAAIKSGDEVSITKAVFNGQRNNPPA